MTLVCSYLDLKKHAVNVLFNESVLCINLFISPLIFFVT